MLPSFSHPQQWTLNTVADDFQKPKVYHTLQNEVLLDKTLLLLVRENVELDLQNDEFHIEIKDNAVEEDEESEAVVASKVKKRKVTISHNSDDSEEKKEKT